MEIFERRLDKFKKVASNRQEDIAVVLENIHDPHNIGAILRTCDSVGIHHIYIITTDPKLQSSGVYNKLSSASGAGKWMSLNFYNDLEPAVKDIKKNFNRLYTTHLGAEAQSVYDIDFNEKCAIAFGNEHEGISDALLLESDQNIVIPQYGMVQSLNISVACAVTLYEACRQKGEKGKYNNGYDSNIENQSQLYEYYQDLHKAKKLRKINK